MTNPNVGRAPVHNALPDILFSQEAQFRAQQNAAEAQAQAAANQANNAHTYASAQAAKATHGSTGAAERAAAGLNQADTHINQAAEHQQTAAEAKADADAFARVMQKFGIKTQAEKDAEMAQRAGAGRETHVQALNDAAEIRVFGSRGRDVVDPATGNKIAGKNVPIYDVDGNLTGTRTIELPSRADIIAKDTRFGTTAAERAKAAQEDQADIIAMTDRGLSLAQAELLANMKLKDRQGAAARIAKVIEQAKADEKAGRTPKVASTDLAGAETLVNTEYKKRQEQREKVVVSKDIHDADTYASYRANSTTGGSADAKREYADGAKKMLDDLNAKKAGEAKKSADDAKAEHDAKMAAARGIRPEANVVLASRKATDDWLKTLNKHGNGSPFRFRRTSQEQVEKAHDASTKALYAELRGYIGEAQSQGVEAAIINAVVQEKVDQYVFGNSQKLAKMEADNAKSGWFSRQWTKRGGADHAVGGAGKPKGQKAKALIVAGTAGVIGAIAGFSARKDEGWAAAGIGGAAGGIAAAIQVARLHNTVLSSPVDGVKGNPEIVAKKRQEVRDAQTNATIAEHTKNGTSYKFEDLTAKYNEQGYKSRERNDRRARNAFGIGVIAAAATAVGVNAAKGENIDLIPGDVDLWPFNNGDPKVVIENNNGGDMPAGLPEVKKPEVGPFNVDQTVNVDTNDGLIENFRDLGVANKFDLNATEAGELFDRLYAKYGTEGLSEHISNVGEVPTDQGPNVGFVRTGEARYDDEILAYMAQEAAKIKAGN